MDVRSATLVALGRGYALKLMQGSDAVFTSPFRDNDDPIPSCLIWRDAEGDRIDGISYDMVVKNSSFEYKNIRYIVKGELNVFGDPPQPKRFKGSKEAEKQERKRGHLDKFSQRLQSDKEGEGRELEGAMAALAELIGLYISAEKDEPKSYRYPAETCFDTWDRNHMENELKDKREKIRETLKTYRPNDRQPVVIGIRLGSGFGKTHVLTEAPELLVGKGIYVTYNLLQDLQVDKKYTVKSLLVRLILTLAGCKQVMCSLFLLENSDLVNGLVVVTEEELRSLFVFYASQLAKGGDLVIGIDELRLLGEFPAKQVVSELAKLAAQYWKETQSMCTVLVSSLASDVFETMSGRTVLDWVPSRPNLHTLEHFAAFLPDERREKAMALANAVSGRHMRSMVMAFRCLGQRIDCSVQYLFDEMKHRMGNKVSSKQLRLIREHTVHSIESTKEKDWLGIEPIMDNSLAVPPVFLKLAFEDQKQQTKSCLDELLHAFSLFGSAGKHLENVSKWFDLFRASLGLAVVPAKAVISINTGVKGAQPPGWYYGLKFYNSMSLSEEALLKQQRADDCGRPSVEIVGTGVVPTPEHYYHPKISNHPWVDIAYVAVHDVSQTKCLVIVQDKVNDSDFSSACDKLNKAAGVLTNLSSDLKHALLIVNVIGAGQSTRAQANLKWPYILIRGKEEVHAFYSANFADMVWFARERHLMAQ